MYCVIAPLLQKERDHQGIPFLKKHLYPPVTNKEHEHVMKYFGKPFD